MTEMISTTISLPPRLVEDLGVFVKAGWFSDVNTLVIEAVRRYLDTHRMELIEQQLMEDVKWGLYGDEERGFRCRAAYPPV